MGRIAHCSGCGRYVELSLDGECPRGHQRSMLRDVREGALRPSQETRPAAVTPPPRGEAAEPNELVAQLLGKGVIIIPLAAIVAFGLWTGYEEAAGSGLAPTAAMLVSVGSLVLTVALAFLWAYFMRRRKR